MNKIIEHTNESFKNIYCDISKGLELIGDIDNMINENKLIASKYTAVETVTIYMIRSPHSNRVYIGSTQHLLKLRFSQHISNFNRLKNGKSKSYCSSFEILHYEDAEIVELDEITATRSEGYSLERHYIELYSSNCVNIFHS